MPGDGINGFDEALRTHKDKIRLVRVRPEEGVALAAAFAASRTAAGLR